MNNSQYNIQSLGNGLIYNWNNPTTYIDHCVIHDCAKYGNQYLFYCDSGGSFSIYQCWLQENIQNNGISLSDCYSVTSTFSHQYINTRECKGNVNQFKTAAKPEFRFLGGLVLIHCLF